MLKMKDVCKIYRTDTVQTHALRGFSLEVEDGEFVSVTGPSGSGKTTFLNIAGLLESASSGNYLLDGQDVSKIGDNQRSRIRNEKIGFKIREARNQKIPYMIIIGDKDRENGTVSVLRRGEDTTSEMSAEDFLSRLNKEVQSRT